MVLELHKKLLGIMHHQSQNQSINSVALKNAFVYTSLPHSRD